MTDGGSSRPSVTAPLVGRDKDVEFIRSFVSQAAIRGGALLLSGEIGVGKTVLLEADLARQEQRAAPDGGLTYERANEFDVLITPDQGRSHARPGRTTIGHGGHRPRLSSIWVCAFVQ